MKKLINTPGTLLTDALTGFAAAHPALDVDVRRRIVTRAPTPGRVSLVSGGGSGHEPLHAGFVGPGMLHAACPGEVFTSPVPGQIHAATTAVSGGAGVLHVVKNYTGDVLNFALAAELADDDGIEIATVIVDDDVAVEDSTHTAGRRGTGATVLVEKIAGAAAENGEKLAVVAEIATEVNARSRSYGVALRAGTVPAVGTPGFTLAEDEMEWGIGIHGEPGRRRGPIAPARDIAAGALDAIAADMPLEGEVLVLVNGMGGTPLMELYVMFAEVTAWLEARGVRVARSLVGDYVTSLDMTGCSITVMRLTGTLRDLWDAPVETPALRWGR
ncbi:dihydroxyacetone kinase subunit DhaK [Actinorhabdospora filicis]|uniref:Dihydroxyacetone kinase subunit DhaK n=1 Tax=Actinorhabdospora filicis TaxID=1785913 RepID=A0A9W6WDL9_9ACTN|nr:dihydroxyacetone kinase subunit DhaK [Actinorhabdospora filicis]GLZ80975.1 dihydroxyacetone kinase subunit DhaK [Actinorhabdospora filicis]